jgi:hypothetical protein
VQFVGANVYAPPLASESSARISQRLRSALTLIDGGKF